MRSSVLITAAAAAFVDGVLRGFVAVDAFGVGIGIGRPGPATAAATVSPLPGTDAFTGAVDPSAPPFERRRGTRMALLLLASAGGDDDNDNDNDGAGGDPPETTKEVATAEDRGTAGAIDADAGAGAGAEPERRTSGAVAGGSPWVDVDDIPNSVVGDRVPSAREGVVAVAAFAAVVAFWVALPYIRYRFSLIEFDIDTYMTIKGVTNDGAGNGGLDGYYFGDNMLEIQPLSPAEQLVGKFFGPPSGK